MKNNNLYKFLHNINEPQDLKKLSLHELNLYAQEVRQFLIDTVSKTGGHLAPNLGVVELTIALHYVFNSPIDTLLWDVGHQSYVHKIITGRHNQFHTLRQKNGITGFPNPKESIHDFVSVGHSSTSISTAVGVATGKKYNNDKSKTIAIIGDGSFTNGMVYEALNDASWRNIPLIIILNDNRMSISENVGGIAKHLDGLRSHRWYLSLKNNLNHLLQKNFIGRGIAKIIYFFKLLLKNKLFKQQNMFENLGVRYFGPYNGHHLDHLISIFKEIKHNSAPILIHVLTQKGQGHQESIDNPISFHGISGYQTVSTQGKSWSKIFGDTLCVLAESNPKIIAITAAMREGTGLVPFSQKFPERLIDVGIAEQHAVTCASGLTFTGFIPVVAIYSTFLQRSYDQIIHDVALEQKHVILCLDRSGLVPNDGKTHQGVFDIAYLRTIPNLIIMSPLVEEEMKIMLEFALTVNAPVAIRYPKENALVLPYTFSPIIKGLGIELESGNDGMFVIFGSLFESVKKAQEKLATMNKNFGIYHLRFAKPIAEEVITYLAKFPTIIVVEEGIQNGGFGQELQQRLSNTVILKNIGDTFPDVDSREGLIENFFPIDYLIKEYL